MAKNFTDWLDNELDSRSWSRAELARRAGVTESSLSLIYSGAREPGTKVCDGIAKAFRIPPDNVYRIAGLLPSQPSTNQDVKELEHIYHELTEDNQEDLLDYARSRLHKQERGDKKKNGKPERVS